VLGLKLEVVDRFGSDLPLWDQWDAEAKQLYEPLAEGRWRVSDLFLPHNEHRVALTRLLSLAELHLNGQWDARLQCVVNGALHAAFAAWLFLLARRGLGAAWSPVLLAVIVPLTGLPLAWQNVTSGFHSQQFLLLLLSLGTFGVLPFAPPFRGRWWGAVACAFLVHFSMASGLLAAAVAAVLIGLRAWRDATPLRAQWPSLAVCAVAVAAGAGLLVQFDPHASLKARNLSDFLLYTVHSLQWPGDWPWVAALLWAPFLALAAELLLGRARRVEGTFAWVVLGLGGWVLAQVLASAYARGAEGGYPASRYLDTLALGLITNAFALALLASRWKGAGRLLLAAVALAWVGFAGHGAYRLAHRIYTGDLPVTRAYLERCEASVRAYLATGQASVLQAGEVPYPNPDVLRPHLDHPAIRALLPASVRPPLRLETARGAEVLALQRNPAATATAGNPAPAARHWSSQGRSPGEWQSVVLRFDRRTTLRLQIAAQFGATPPELEWRDGQLGRTLARIELPARPDGQWREVELTLPSGPAYLLVRTGTDGWVAFTEPVEVARLSAWAAAAAAAGSAWWKLAVALGLVLAFVDAWRGRDKPCPAA
jgi:hypothetical protein